MSLTLEISPAPGNRNNYGGRKGWWAYHRERVRVQKEVTVQCLQAGKKNWPKWPVLVSLHRIGYADMDPYGVAESVKPVMDALVQCGVIPDDSKKYVVPGPVTQEIDRKTRVMGLPVSRLLVTLESINTTPESQSGTGMVPAATRRPNTRRRDDPCVSN